MPTPSLDSYDWDYQFSSAGEGELLASSLPGDPQQRLLSGARTVYQLRQPDMPIADASSLDSTWHTVGYHGLVKWTPPGLTARGFVIQDFAIVVKSPVSADVRIEIREDLSQPIS